MDDAQKQWLSETPVGEMRAVEVDGVRYEIDRRLLPTPWSPWMSAEPHDVTVGDQTWITPDPTEPHHPVISCTPRGWRA